MASLCRHNCHIKWPPVAECQRLLVNRAIILQNVMFLTLVKYFPSKKACDVWLQLHNHVRATDEITPDLMRQTHSPGLGNEWVAPLFHILQGREVERSMRIPPFFAIFLLHPTNLEALQHQNQPAPGPTLLASSIQVLPVAFLLSRI